MENKRYLYFAYDNDITKSKIQKICPNVKLMYRAKLYGARLIFKDNDKVTIRRNKGSSFVDGVLYSITASDMRKLDKVKRHPKKRNKVSIIIHDKNGIYQRAFTYIIDVPLKNKLPSNKLFTIIHDGYLDWGINPSGLFYHWELQAAKEMQLDNIEKDELLSEIKLDDEISL